MEATGKQLSVHFVGHSPPSHNFSLNIKKKNPVVQTQPHPSEEGVHLGKRGWKEKTRS